MRPRIKTLGISLALFAIVAISVGQAAYWAFLVPIYQSPDEPAHLDYALAIHAHKNLLFAQHTDFKSLPTHAHPYTPYLMDKSSAASVIFNPGVKLPPDYGTPEFFANVERDAPDLRTSQAAPTCQLAALYPSGYYALLAAWIELVRHVCDGVVAMFFGARLLSVALLAISLPLNYATSRLLGYQPRFCLFVTACIGLFPLTSFVSSYVQPDNLSFALVSLSFYLSLRARKNGMTIQCLAAIGLALGLLLSTKTHYWLCVTTAVAAMVFAEFLARRKPTTQWAAAAFALGMPSAVLGALRQWTVWGTQNYFAPPADRTDGVTQFVRMTRQAFDDYFAGGTHNSFWGVYGWLDTPLVIGNHRITAVVFLAIQIATWVLLGATLVRFERVASRLFCIARQGRTAATLRIAASNPVINAYFIFTAFMVFLYIWNANRFGAQGRNWFPLILPIFLVGLSYAPKAFTLKSTRIAVSTSLAIGLLLFAIVGNHFARQSIRDRYYVQPGDIPMTPMPFKSDPCDCIETIWNDRVGECLGSDPYLVFALDRPTFVHGIKIRFTTTNRDNVPAKFQAFWKNGAEEFVEDDRTARYTVASGEEQSITVWICREISHFRIDPDNAPCRFELGEITLLRESDESWEARIAARRTPATSPAVNR